MGDFSPPNWEETLGNLRGSWTQSYASWSVWGVLNRQRNSRPILDHHSPMELYSPSWGFRFGNARLPRDRSEFGNESSNLEFADRRLKNQAICQLKARWIPGWEKALMKGSLSECNEPKKSTFILASKVFAEWSCFSKTMQKHPIDSFRFVLDGLGVSCMERWWILYCQWVWSLLQYCCSHIAMPQRSFGESWEVKTGTVASGCSVLVGF